MSGTWKEDALESRRESVKRVPCGVGKCKGVAGRLRDLLGLDAEREISLRMRVILLLSNAASCLDLRTTRASG